MKPGQDIIDRGIRDLETGKETIESLLVSIGAPRLREAGILVPQNTFATPEHRLYALLYKSDGDGAHSKYNSLIRRLVSFERAAECGL
ncbi:MAG: hypothetical protein KF756_10880 [Acidobacteria bacterium]|nr:hypothetical protein [Acidobacteriota bacterium]